MNRHFLILSLFFLPILPVIPAVHGQINFGGFGGEGFYELNVAVGISGPSDGLNFGMVTVNSTESILIDQALEVSIIGVDYLDVFIDIDVGFNGYLLLDGDTEHLDDEERRIPITLFAAYSNVGENNNSYTESVDIPIVGNFGTARFPIMRHRYAVHESAPFGPPGPPPPPPNEAIAAELAASQYEETAILYLYGSIDAGDIVAGNYEGVITITASYEVIPGP